MADFTNLTGDALRNYYQQLTALRRGTEPDTVAIPEKDDAWFQRRLTSAAESFVVDGDLRDRDVDTDPTTVVTPLQQFRARLRAVLDGSATDAGTMLLVEATASSVYGFPVDFSDGQISERDREQLTRLQGLFESNMPLSEIFAVGAGNTQAVLDAARRLEEQRQLEEAQARATEVERSQTIYTLESAAAALGFGTVNGQLSTLPQTALGQPGHELDRVLVEYSEQLQRQFPGNIFAIRERMFTSDGNGGLTPTPYANEVMGYLVQNTDLSGRITELAASSDPNDIRQLQGILRLSGVEGAREINTTGVMDLRTMNATIAALETPRGMGDTTLAFTHAPAGSPLTHNVSPAMIIDQLERGVLDNPTALSDEQMASLPAEFRERLELLREDVDGLPPLEQREMIADFLAEAQNYTAYDAYLMSRTADPELMASLRAQLPALEEAARVEAAAATSVLSLADLSSLMGSLTQNNWAESDGVNAALIGMETAIASGDVAAAHAGAVQVVTTIDSEITAAQLQFVNQNIHGFRRVGHDSNNEVLTNGTPEEILAYLKDNQADLSTIFHGDNMGFLLTSDAHDWSRLQRARVEVDRIAGELGVELPGRAAVDPARAAPADDPVIVPEAEPEVVAAEPVDRSVAALVAESAQYAAYRRISSDQNPDVAPEVRNAYNAIPVDLARDPNAPDALRRLAGMKEHIETALRSFDEGTYEGNPIPIQSEISHYQDQFQTALERLRQSGEGLTEVNRYLSERGIAEIPATSFEAPAEEGPSWWDRNISPLFSQAPADATEPGVRVASTFVPGPTVG